jgi:pyridoxine kinase
MKHPAMKQILSIQSHVAYGYVGNRAATLPLQRLGHEVTVINTVQFSNHTGYLKWTGEVFSAAHIESIIEGLESLGALQKMDALLTGYLGDPAIGEIILSVLDRLPEGTRWLCDPVMGDVGRGFFVRPGIPDYFRQKALARASIITPNQFELEYLAGRQILTLDDARKACRMIHEMGPETVLLTSLIHDGTRDDEIQMLASSKSGEQFLATTPRLKFDPAPNGAGDCTSALFLGHILSGAQLDQALSKTASSIFALFEKTLAAGRRELNMIAAQDDFARPAPLAVMTL